MFERFTKNAKLSVVAAQENARDLGAEEIGAEHILLGVLDQGPEKLVETLGAAGVTREAVLSHLGKARSPEALEEEDAAALRAIGIDLDAVRSSVAESFGADILANERASERKWPWQRRKWFSHLPFTGAAKRSLARALREARDRGDGWIGAEHIALGLLSPGSSYAAEIMTRERSADAVRAAIAASIDKAA